MDREWIEARQFSVSELSRWLRIPPHKIGQLTDATFSNIESQTREYVCDTLTPWLVRWEQEIQRKLIDQGSPFFAEHLLDSLLRGNTEARFASYRIAIEAGFMTRNEVREKENLNPTDGLDEFIQPLNMGQVGNSDDS